LADPIRTFGAVEIVGRPACVVVFAVSFASGCVYDRSGLPSNREREHAPVSACHFPSKWCSRSRRFHGFAARQGRNCGGLGTNLRLA
jgi:hypothetical protein